MTGTLHEDPYTFLIISRLFLLVIRNVSDKFVEKIKTHMSNNFFFENRAVYETTWKKYCRDRKATDDNKVHANCVVDA